jgi:membrane protein insertase Oxa1/YidC/SpoIIIJ
VLSVKKEEEKQTLLNKDSYDKVMGALRKDDYYTSANGYLILPILSILLALVNQVITHIQQKRSGQDMNGQSGMTMKIMMWTMPVMIGFFAFMNVAAFALYLVVSYVVTLIVSLIMMFIYHIMDKKMDDDEFVHTYGRPNFNK